jgi:putative ABC transport system ATP-binding protein
MISAQNISHYYKQDIALKDINLEIHKGEFVAIVGESGSGKSTLLSILSTLLTPSKGEVFFNGISLEEIKNIDKFRKENIGFIFQFHYLIEYLNVKENLKIANEKVSEKRIEKLSKRLGIEKLLEKFPNTLSGGERQRVAIIRALINNPKVIFADEPTGNLDSKNAAIVFELLKELSQEGTTIIVTTHNKELAQLADTMYEVKDGQL